MRKASVYKVQLPRLASTLNELIAQAEFKPCLTNALSSVGFIPHPMGEGQFALNSSANGYSFAVRMDEKIIPAKTIDNLVADEVTKIKLEEPDYILTKDDKKELRAKILAELVPNAVCKCTTAIAYYSIGQEHLYIDGSDVLQNYILRKLVDLMKSITTKTIHVSDVNSGLQVRLLNTLGGDNQLGDFKLGCKLKLKSDKDSISYTGEHDLEYRVEEIRQQLLDGYKVEEAQLYLSDMISFVLTKGFTFKSIKSLRFDDSEFETPLEKWQHETATSIFCMDKVVGQLVELLEYKDKASAA